MAATAKLTRSAVLATALVVATTAAARTPTGLADLLVGEYNNNEQVWQQGQDGTAPGARVHWRFGRLGDARIGVSRAAGQSAPVEPAWLLTFDGETSSVATAGGVEQACAYRWGPADTGGYTGVAVGNGDCPAELPAIWHLTKDYLVASYVDGVDEVIHRARRVIHYTGWVALSRRHIDTAAATDDFILMRGLVLHNEGFVVSITDDGEPTGYAVELARLTYQRTHTAVLKLGIVDESTGETVNYGWAGPGAERIGVNLRWVQAGMTRKP